MKRFKPKSLNNQTWYKGGDLHQAPIRVWHDPKTTYQNALATCSDYIWAASKLDVWLIEPFQAQDQVLEMASQLAGVLIRSTEDQLDAVGHMRAHDLAVISMAQLGWLKSESQPVKA